MRRVEKILPRALERELVDHGKAHGAMRKWEDVVGPALATRSWPDRYDHGVVWVAVKGSAWAQELRLMKETILKRLRGLVDDPGLFRDVRFGVRALPERPLAEQAAEAPREELSIAEIAKRRLERWKDEPAG